MIVSNQGKLFACLLLLFGKKTRQVDQVVITVPAVTQDLALVVNVEPICQLFLSPLSASRLTSLFFLFVLQILTVTAPLDVDQILVIRADKSR